MVDRHRKFPGDARRGNVGSQSVEGGALGWEPSSQVSQGRHLVLSLSELRGQCGDVGGLGPLSPDEVWFINL